MSINKMSKRTLIIIAIACLLTTFVGGLALGVIGGLVYAWVYEPVEFVDGMPSQLSDVYQDIYVGLVVDSYTINHDMNLVSAYLGAWEDPEIIQLLSKKLDCAISQEDFERAELIRDILLTYHDPSDSNP